MEYLYLGNRLHQQGPFRVGSNSFDKTVVTTPLGRILYLLLFLKCFVPTGFEQTLKLRLCQNLWKLISP